MKGLKSFGIGQMLVSVPDADGKFVELSSPTFVPSELDFVNIEPSDVSIEPITLDFEVDCATNLRALFPTPHKNRIPRKQKKAIGQMWNIGCVGDEVNVSFECKHRTRWQRRVLREVKCNNGTLSIPMKNGFTFVVDAKQTN